MYKGEFYSAHIANAGFKQDGDMWVKLLSRGAEIIYSRRTQLYLSVHDADGEEVHIPMKPIVEILTELFLVKEIDYGSESVT